MFLEIVAVWTKRLGFWLMLLVSAMLVFIIKTGEDGDPLSKYAQVLLGAALTMAIVGPMIQDYSDMLREERRRNGGDDGRSS